MGVMARRTIRPDATDDLVTLYDRRVAEHEVLSGALDARMKELSALKAELEALLGPVRTLEEANAVRAQADEYATAANNAALLREASINNRQGTLDGNEAAFARRDEAMKLKESALAKRVADAQSDIDAAGKEMARRRDALDTAEAALTEGQKQLAADKKALAKERKAVNALLAKLQQPE